MIVIPSRPGSSRVPARFPAQPREEAAPEDQRHRDTGACEDLRKLKSRRSAATTIIERGNSLKESAVVLSTAILAYPGIAALPGALRRDDDALGRQTSTIHFDTASRAVRDHSR